MEVLFAQTVAIPEFTAVAVRRLRQPGTPQRIVAQPGTFRFFLTGGEIEFFLPESRDPVPLTRRMILMLRPEEEALYSSSSPRPVPYLRLELTVKQPGRTEPPPRLAEFRYAHPVFGVADRLDEALANPGPCSAALARLLAQEFWLYLHEQRAGTGSADPRLDRMLRYLEERLLEHPTRQQLAREFNLSPQQVNLLFRRNLGISPGEYVQRQLIRSARQLLRTGKLSVKETSARLGFANPFYFSRIFKKITGHAPSEN